MILGNQIIRLNEIASTNDFLIHLQSEKLQHEGVVVVAKSQTKGKGQRGNSWEAADGLNLTMSFLLKPNIIVNEQFLISKIIALGLYDFLKICRLNAQIKWPNDVYVNGKKIAGILIENTIGGNKISSSVVGIGLNVNQIRFSDHILATSLKHEMGEELLIEEVMRNLLIAIEKRYLQLKSNRIAEINEDYLSHLIGLNVPLQFIINETLYTGIIRGVSSLGKLQLEINKELKEFGLQEIKFVR